jgi:hypothetical protein
MLYTVKMAKVVEKMAQIYWGVLQIGESYTISNEACVKLMDDFNSNFFIY